MSSDRPSFTTLPTEILEAIFLHLDPHSFLSISQTCKAINSNTADAPVVWRHFCKTSFRSWCSQHDIATKLAGPLSQVDWRGLFIHRFQKNKETRRLLDTMLESQQGRTKCITEIADFGYDAKDVLLQERACSEDAKDALARKYYAMATSCPEGHRYTPPL